jgi:hypothetical protein
MPPKRPRSATTTMSPSTKKIIVEPEYRKLTEWTLRRIRGNIPADVTFINIQIDAVSNREMAEKLQKLILNVKDENKVAILIGVTNYSANQNLPNHAIAVYKWGDILYCFDSWGANRNKISTTIFKIIYEMIKTKRSKLQIYNGPNLQAYNTYGVCVGLASNFIIIMANRTTHIRQFYSLLIKRILVKQTINNIASNLQAKTLALSKVKSPTGSPMNINRKTP